jgi:uncharacterized protein (TIGR02284 family)
MARKLQTPSTQEESVMADRTEREVLNQLIETCRDGELGFRTAAEHVGDASLRTLLLEMADERARCAAELLPHAQRLGGAATHDGTSMGALHRRWIDLKSSLKRNDDRAILVEVTRGDKATVHAYKDAVEGSLPPDTRDVVEQQYALLQKEHDRIARAEQDGRVQ